jgi:predicted neutral ceramidase superfamily lipid hydrolase
MAIAMQWVSRITTISLSMALPAGLGYWLDRHWGISPWLTIVGAVLGFAAAMAQLLQLAQKSGPWGIGIRTSDAMFMVTAFMVTANVATPAQDQSTLRRCALLLGIACGAWVVLSWPAWRLAGADGLTGLSIAAALCTVPGLIVFALAAAMRGPSQGVVIALGGTALRLVFVLVGALAVQAVQPQLRFREFLVWLLAYYVIMLAAETLLVVRKTGDRSGPGASSAEPRM